MRYPAFLLPGQTIGLVAPSLGISGYPYRDLYDSAINQLTEKGYRFKFSEHLLGNTRVVSALAIIRGFEMMKMMTDPQVQAIISVAGGELMCEMIPYVDFEALKKNTPKWFLGYSDNTFMTFLLTTLADTAALYGSCFTSFGMKPWDLAVTETWQVLTGQLFQQHSYDTYQREDQKQQPGKALAGYNKTEPVAIKCLGEERDIQISGRLIGGCLDVLQHLVGTKFDRVKEFNTRYGTDGIIWFFEACDLNVMGIQTALWQLRQAGWIDENCRGIIFGRPANPNSLWDTDLPTAYIQALDGLNIPVIYDLDIGHCPPCWTLISGSFATVTKHQNKAEISYQLK